MYHSYIKREKKLQNSISHVNFLTQSEKSNVIPKFCRLKSIPGRTENSVFKEKLEVMILKQNLVQEKEALDRNIIAVEKSLHNIKLIFNNSEAGNIINIHETHCRKVLGFKEEKQTNKHLRDIASSTKNKVNPPKKKARKRRQTCVGEGVGREGDSEGEGAILRQEGWNGGVKNFSSKTISKAEEKLLNRNRKFAPMELDPPQLRNQQELDRWIRSLHLQYQFFDQPDTTSEIEKKFYQPNKSYEPSIVSHHLETFKSAMQREYDQWKPPRYVKDNISREEREFLKEARKDEELALKVEREVQKWKTRKKSQQKLQTI